MAKTNQAIVKKNFVSIGIAASISSLLYLAGIGFFIGEIDFWGNDKNLMHLVLPFLISLSGCLLLGWFNSRFLAQALVGAVIAILIGIPIAFLLLAPMSEFVLQILIPHSNIQLSGSFSGVWFLISPVILIEIITDNIVQSGRWKGLIGGVLLISLITIGIEILTSNLGQTSKLSFVRLTVYAPMTWCIAVMFTNYKTLLGER